jgi:predicted ArsR family transcriptional regulator
LTYSERQMAKSAKPRSRSTPAREVTTRETVVASIRSGCKTVEDIAAALGITDNAVRFHIKALEKAGLVQAVGVLRTGSAGKPAEIYEMTRSGEELQSRAYAPALTACVEELGKRMDPSQLRRVMRSVGGRLASDAKHPTGNLQSRIRSAAGVLEELGGVVTVERGPDGTTIKGEACPLASVVAKEPITCGAIQSMLSELIGAPVAEKCEHTATPRCRFLIHGVDAA